MTIHPARLMGFAELYEGIKNARDAGLVYEQIDGPLSLFCYTRETVYTKNWTPITTLCRGLVIDREEKRVVATPWPKFFNYGEMEQSIPDLPFEVTEKVDGSMVALWFHHGRWRASTKGSFQSDQAKWAERYIHSEPFTELFVPGVTYLCEEVGPHNKIVVPYQKSCLVFLSAYGDFGHEFPHHYLLDLANTIGWPCAIKYNYDSISQLLVNAKNLPATEEGFVVRFSNGLRVKIKGDEYLRLHRLVSDVTPLALWNAMLAGDDLEKVRRDLPEEFWTDFDRITEVLQLRLDLMLVYVKDFARKVDHLSDKEVGLQLNAFPETIRRFIFPYRKSGGDLLNSRARRGLFDAIRPTANQLPGYVPSSAMHRVLEEVA